jgi:hypothetical protein
VRKADTYYVGRMRICQEPKTHSGGGRVRP